MSGRAISWTKRLAGDAVSRDAMDTAPRLTLLLLTLYSGRYWEIRVPMALLCATALLSTRLSRSWVLWLSLTLVLCWGNMRRIYVVDNHKVLMTWWCIARPVRISSPQASAVAVKP